MRPRKYQEKIISEIIEFYKKENIGQLILPCGYGKTFIILYYLSNHNYNNILFVVPSLNLIKQVKNEILKICPEYKIFYINEKNNLRIIELLFNRSSKEKKILLTTYSNLIRNSIKNKYDFIVFDETHILYGNEYKSVLRLFESELKSKTDKIILMSATPLNYLRFNNHTSYTNEKLYGKEIIRIFAYEAIKEKILRPIEVKSFQKIEVYDELKLLEAEAEYFIEKYFEDKRKKSIIFVDSIEEAEELYLILNEKKELNNIYIDYVHSKLKSKEVNRILDNFKRHKKAILINVNIISEGTDIENIDSIFYFNKKSTSKFLIQSSGRATRVRKNENGYILDEYYNAPSYLYVPVPIGLEKLAKKRNQMYIVLDDFYHVGIYRDFQVARQNVIYSSNRKSVLDRFRSELIKLTREFMFFNVKDIEQLKLYLKYHKSFLKDLKNRLKNYENKVDKLFKLKRSKNERFIYFTLNEKNFDRSNLLFFELKEKINQDESIKNLIDIYINEFYHLLSNEKIKNYMTKIERENLRLLNDDRLKELYFIRSRTRFLDIILKTEVKNLNINGVYSILKKTSIKI